MLDRVVLKDFKTHRHTEIALSRLTVLVGPNGSGKSSVLTAIDCACQFPLSAHTQVFRDTRDAQHLCRRGAQAFSVSVSGEGWQIEAGEQVEPAPTNSTSRENQKFARLQVGGEPHDLHASGCLSPHNGTALVGPRRILRLRPEVRLLSLDATSLGQPAPPEMAPGLGGRGEKLVSVLANMRLFDPAAVAAVEHDVRRLVPIFRSLRIQSIEIGGRVHYELAVDFDHARAVPAHGVSEGTLLAIGLMTVLHQEPRPQLLLLDDLDRGLHPRAQRELIAILRRLLEVHPELQIVATSHSPYLVDELRPEEVWVCALDAEGISHCRNLATHPRAERLLEVLTTGELLSAEGDDWVLAEDPVNANA